MDFLKNIIRRFQKGTKRKSAFYEEVMQEKKNRYLFRDKESEKYTSSRKTFFREQKRKLSPFTNFIQTNLNLFDRERRDNKTLGYIGGILITLSAYIIIFSPYFKVSPNNVLVEAVGGGIDMNIAYRAMEDTYGKSLFLLDETETAYVIKKHLKNTAHITIDKLYPNGIKVIITGSPITYEATIFGLSKKWNMSENGVLLPDSSNERTLSGATLKKFEIISEGLKNELFLDYKQVISDEKMLVLSKTLAMVQNEWPTLVLGKIRYFAMEDEMHISLENGTKILLSLQSPDGKNDYLSTMNHIKRELSTLKNYILANAKLISE